MAEPDITVITTGPVLRFVGRLEIRDDRITYLPFAERGDGREVTRVSCRGMTLTGSGRFRRLKVVGLDRSADTLGLFGFDVERVREAALAHGWPWESTDTGPAPVPARRETEIVLRQGRGSAPRVNRLTVWIDEERVAVRRRSPMSWIARRSAVASVRPGRRSAAIRNQAGRRLLKVPLVPRRDEVLQALRAHGWPLDE